MPRYRTFVIWFSEMKGSGERTFSLHLSYIRARQERRSEREVKRRIKGMTKKKKEIDRR